MPYDVEGQFLGEEGGVFTGEGEQEDVAGDKGGHDAEPDGQATAGWHGFAVNLAMARSIDHSQSGSEATNHEDSGPRNDHTG